MARHGRFVIFILLLGIISSGDINAQKQKFYPVDSLVTVGYATGSLKTISGSVEKITEKQMNKEQLTNPLEAIRGRVPGLTIQRGSNGPAALDAVRLRGTTSLTSGNDPLIIVDGVFGDLSMLTSIYPTDIESFTILKDASETAQYGSRGASGVIEITTKKGMSGKTQVAYNNTLSDLYLNAVASLYTYVGGYSDSQGLQGTGRGVYDLNTFTTDEAIIPTRGGDWYDGGFWQGLFLHKCGIENDAIQATWEYLYKMIMLCNKSLERIDQFSKTHTDAELSAYRAEVQAMRAMYYYYLMDLFGSVPLILTSSPAMSDVVQSDRKIVFDFVVDELQHAAPLLGDAHSN